MGLFDTDPASLGDVVLSDALDLLRSLGRETVAVVVADPPYGIAYHSNRYQDKNPHAPVAQDWNFHIGGFLAETERVLRDTGALYLFTRWDVYPLWAKEVPPSLALKNLIVWDKGNHSSGDLTGNFGFQHEVIMFLVKGRHTIRGKRWSNVWEAPRIPHKKLRMPAQKPLEIYERALLASSDLGDLVVDPFVGSGTMAEAAVRNGRRFLVGDVDAKMVRLARERIGLSVADLQGSRVMSVCPVFRIVPPDPSLWGLHPEDLFEWRNAMKAA